MVKRFFQSLAHRLYREQNLSDITWALAESDESFKQTFMDLFFKDFDAKKPHENKRECFKADSRPDILLRQDDLTYVIEVKISDKQNYHFKQYADAFKDEDVRFGFISAYKLHLYELDKAASLLPCHAECGSNHIDAFVRGTHMREEKEKSK
jgi:hypothetical protein